MIMNVPDPPVLRNHVDSYLSSHHTSMLSKTSNLFIRFQYIKIKYYTSLYILFRPHLLDTDDHYDVNANAAAVATVNNFYSPLFFRRSWSLKQQWNEFSLYFQTYYLSLFTKWNHYVYTLKMYLVTQLVRLASLLVTTTEIRQIGRNLRSTSLNTPSISSPTLSSSVRNLNTTKSQTTDNMNEVTYVIYILQLEHNCWYVGSTTNLIARWAEHLNSKGARWTAMYRPVRLHSYERTSQKDVTGREMLRTCELMYVYLCYIYIFYLLLFTV